MPKKRLYMAYGSNINLDQMAYRCPTAGPVATAVLKDYALLFRGGRRGGVATIEPQKGAAVPVLLWAIKPEDELSLDHYEGFPGFYGKQMMEVELGGKTVSAMAYVMTPGHAADRPTSYYLNVIAEGYAQAGFNLGVIAAAVKRTEDLISCEENIRESRYWERRFPWEGQAAQLCMGDVFDNESEDMDEEELDFDEEPDTGLGMKWG